jgi:hypothetical protein
MVKKRKKPRIYMEEAKRRHTTHWDIDYLPREEVEALYGLDAESSYDAKANGQIKDKGDRRHLVIKAVVVLIVMIMMIIWYLL